MFLLKNANLYNLNALQMCLFFDAFSVNYRKVSAFGICSGLNCHEFERPAKPASSSGGCYTPYLVEVASLAGSDNAFKFQIRMFQSPKYADFLFKI